MQNGRCGLNSSRRYDGHFVPNISIGAPVIAAMKKVCDVPFDVHLMISDPYFYIEDFVKAGADIITFHIECDSNINKTIDKIMHLAVRLRLQLSQIRILKQFTLILTSFQWCLL